MDVYRGVFLYGGSGSGKSSLVNAGLLPQARLLGFDPVRVRVQPRAGEEIVIEPIGLSDDADEFLPRVLAPDDDVHVVLSIADFEQAVRDASDDHQPLIIFDQFEEILTLFEDDEASRRNLAEMIVRLLRDSLPVKLLFAFREDYLGRVKQLLAARPELVDQALRLGPPSADALQTIIRGPFERFPGHYQRELTTALTQRVGDALAQRFGTGEVSLSEVQTVCLRLWQSPNPGPLLAEKGVQGLLEDELGEALQAFSPELRAAAIGLLSHMVTSAGTRNVISAEDLRQRVQEDDTQIPTALLDEALDRLERESKLVRRERRRDIYLYEITSEFLVPWISGRRDEQRRHLERARERRRRRIIASVVGALLIIVTVVSTLAVFAFAQRATAQRRANEARHQRQLAQERARQALSARGETDTQATRARRLQVLAQRRATDAQHARNRATREARNARAAQRDAQRQARTAKAQGRETHRALVRVAHLQARLLDAAQKACKARGGSAKQTTPTKILCKQVRRQSRLPTGPIVPLPSAPTGASSTTVSSPNLALVDYSFLPMPSGGRKVMRMLVRRVPAGGTVVVACRGRGCAFSSRTIKRHGSVSLAQLFRGRTLSPGTIVEILVTGPNRIGKLITFTTRKAARPAVKVRCVPPGTTKPLSCG